MIHYHGTPIHGSLDTRLCLRGRHAIVSFANPGDIEMVAELCQSFCLDNGAFTAWKQGKDYDPKAYVEWANHWFRHPGCDWALAPDVIDGDEKANKERLRMVPHCAQWVPIWHLHESLEWLEQLTLTWPRIALGSSGEWPDPGVPKWWSRISEAMEVICDSSGRPRTKIHGLRMLDPVLFSHIPFSSADSTNVARSMGLDNRWSGPYVPRSTVARALVIMDRIESHASAWRWNFESQGVQQNMDLLG